VTVSLETRLRKLEGVLGAVGSPASGDGVRVADRYQDELATIQAALVHGVARLPADERQELAAVFAGIARGLAAAGAIRDPESLDPVLQLAEALRELDAPPRE
jgi:hypothetical protein